MPAHTPTEREILRQARDLGVAPAVIELPYLKAEHAAMLELLTRAQAAFFGDGTRKALLPVMQEIAAFRRERAK